MLHKSLPMSAGTGYGKVESDVACVITRFEVRSTVALLRFYWSFRRVRAQSRRIPGLLASLFLIENRRTCYTLSLWQDEAAILRFNTQVVAHVHAANACFRDLATVDRRALLWSAQFKLFAVSPNNLRWRGVDVMSASCRRETMQAVRPAGVAQ